MQIAVVGISILAKKVQSINDLREVLWNGSGLIGDFPQERKKDVYAFLPDANRYAQYGGNIDMNFAPGAYIDEVDKFDSDYFSIAPNEAAVMDPAQRLFLQCGMNCILSAGYNEEEFRGSETGVFVGFMPDFRPFNYRDLVIKNPDVSIDQATVPNLISVIPSRLSYYLDLAGPSICVDTSCSSALVAIQLACDSLRQGRCKQAVAGAVKLNLAPFSDLPRATIESPRFRSHTFDASADGVGIGEGVGAVLLKPLAAAERDGDYIWAVISGYASNQDGRSNGIACPNENAQKNVILAAWKDAGVGAEEIGYFEAHGTGTRVGDPIELRALQQAFSSQTDKLQYCGVGSVKTNFGHWYEAAGILSFCKVVASVHFGEIYKHLNLEKLTDAISLESSPFFIPLESEKWPVGDSGKRTAGVSGFGVSGTNAHIVVESYLSPNAARKCRPGGYPLLITAPAWNAICTHLDSHLSWLKDVPEANLKDYCFSAISGRRPDRCKIALIAPSKKELEVLLQQQLHALRTQDLTYDDAIVVETGRVPKKTSQLVREYFKQGTLDKTGLFGQTQRRVPLPPYPFARKRHWVELADHWLYGREYPEPAHFICKWVTASHTNFDTDGDGPRGKVLVVRGEDARSEEILGELRKEWSDKLIEVASLSEDISRVDPDEISRIIDLSALSCQRSNTLQELDRNVEQASGSLFQLLSILTRSRNSREPLRIDVISEYAFSILDSDCPVPECSIAPNLTRTLDRETSSLIAYAMDIDASTTASEVLRVLVTRPNVHQVALRKGQLFTKEFAPKTLEGKASSWELMVREDGFYLITGGTGGLGLVIAEKLSRSGARTLLLVSKSGVVKRGQKSRILDRILELGVCVELVACDIADASRLNQVVSDAIATHGQLRGIVHAAGLPGSHLIGHQSVSELKKVVDPKVRGGFVLGNLAKSESVDFIIFYSSVAVHFPAVGQGDYCAANVYLDELALDLKRSGVNAYSVQWVAWKEIGMAYDLGSNVNTTFRAIDSVFAISCLEKMLAAKESVCLIGQLNDELDVAEVFASYRLRISPAVFASSRPGGSTSAYSTPVTSVRTAEAAGRTKGDYSKVERQLVRAWGEILGYESVDVFRDIQAFGADSLAHVSIMLLCKEKFNISIEMADIVESANIAELARAVEQRPSEPGKASGPVVKNVNYREPQHQEPIEREVIS